MISTERLILRVLELRDRDFILELVSGADWIANIGDRGVRTLHDAESYIAKIQASQKTQGFSFYGVFLKQLDGNSVGLEGMGIGICGLTKRDDLPIPDIGFAFLPRYYRQGYALESGRAVLDYAKGVLGLSEIAAITSLENTASIRVLEKLGLQFEREFTREFDLRAPSEGHALKYFSKKL